MKRSKNAEKRPKTIHLWPSQIIGRGRFAYVYRISPRRIVKVFSILNISKLLAQDEILGSLVYERALPVLGVIRVIQHNVTKSEPIRETIGLIREYVPNKIDYDEYQQCVEWDDDCHDGHSANYRRDAKGQYFLIDTGTPRMWNFYDHSDAAYMIRRNERANPFTYFDKMISKKRKGKCK